jgi:hypothetical protein
VLWVPGGSDEDAIVRAEGATTSDRVTDLVWAGELASATATVKLAVPLAVGVPEIRPVDVFRLRPAGRFPERKDQVYGAVPPLAWSEFEYPELTVLEGKDEEVMVRGVGVTGAEATDKVTVAVADCAAELESTTETPKE